MSLIFCPDCKKEISSLASVCIHCGYPVELAKKVKPSEEALNIIRESQIEMMKLDRLVYLKLNECNIHTIGQLCDVSMEDIEEKCNFTHSRALLIKGMLMKLGLDFAKNTTYEGFCKSGTKYKIATKYDHSTEKLPEGVKKYIFYVNSDLTDDEIAALKKGFIPPNAEWKWFMYYESGVLNLYRSWTGKCIYRIVFGKVSQRLMVIYYSHEEDAIPAIKHEQFVIELLHSMAKKAMGYLL